MRAILDENATIAAWTEVERAISRAQGELGIIPGDAADTIANSLDASSIDLDQLHQDTRHVGRPIVGLATQLSAQVPEPHNQWVHYGFTTYDVMDTASALQSMRATTELQSQLNLLRKSLEQLAVKHRDTLMIGRTNGQHAQPTTFGARVATWIEELLRQQYHLQSASSDAFNIQLGGMVGSLASFDDQGLKLRQKAAGILGLNSPVTNWHNARDGFARLVQALGLVNATLARIARDIADLESTDFGEAFEAGETGRGKSSGMPHKRNPRAAEFAQAVATLGRQRAAGITEVMGQQHERSGGTYIAEWMLVPETFLLSSGAIAWSRELFDRLQIDEERMRSNLDDMRGLELSERYTLALAKKIPKTQARRLIDEACERVYQKNCSMDEALASIPAIGDALSSEELESLSDPTTYLGVASDMIDSIVDSSSAQEF